MLHPEFTPDAFITLSNGGGIEIMLNHSNDGVYFRYNYGQENIKDEYIYDAEIVYNEDNEAGFFQYNTGNNPEPIFYSLSKAMKIK